MVSQFKAAAERMAVPPDMPPTDRFLGDPELQALFNRALEVWNTTHRGTTIEEFYSEAELLSLLGRANAEEDLAAIQYLILRTVSGKPDAENPYVRFLREIQGLVDQGRKNVASLGSNPVSIISLNWDLLLDEAAKERNKKSWMVPGVKPLDQPHDVDVVDDGAILLAKPHGSLNWWLCKECNQIYADATLSMALDAWEESAPPCPVERHELQPGFIPPGNLKLDRDSAFGIVWGAAFTAMQRATDVIFVGYSFPEADPQFRTLSRMALAANPDLVRIVVVTSPKHGHSRTAFEDRLTSVFPNRDLHGRLRFVYQRFEEWVAGGLLLESH